MLVCRHDNEQLRHQMQGQLETRSCDSSSKTAPSGSHEAAMLGILTTKLQEAAAQSEKMKAELKKLKQVILFESCLVKLCPVVRCSKVIYTSNLVSNIWT